MIFLIFDILFGALGKFYQKIVRFINKSARSPNSEQADFLEKDYL